MEFFAKYLIKLRCLPLQVLLVLPSLVFLAIWDNVVFAKNLPKVQNLKMIKPMLPQWIDQEKIRAGYLYAKDDTKYAALMHSNGINTVIAKANICHENALEDYRRWARACKNEKLHLFIAYNWQPDPKTTVYRGAVYSDGTVGKAPCPRDHEYWQNYLIHFGKIIAELSNKPDLQVDGIFLDCELYGSEGNKRQYGHHTCFCDDCFSSFLHSEGYTDSRIPSIGRGDREEWLKKNDLLESYFAYLKKDVESLAKRFEQEIHKINPSLIIGMYPTPNDWVLTENARGFGTVALPMIIFATDSYSSGGYHSIPDEPSKLYKNSGIYSRYVAGFLLRCYGNDGLGINLYNVAEKCSGYWIFKMPMLWEPPSNRHHMLADGNPDEYWQSTAKANSDIDMLIGETGFSMNEINILQGWKLLNSKALEEKNRDYKLPNVSFRGKKNFLVYAEMQKLTQINLYFKRLAKYDDDLEYKIISPSGQTLLIQKVYEQGPIKIDFNPPITGVYLLTVNVGKCKFRIDSTNTPIAASDCWGFHTIGLVEPLYFYVSAQTEKVVILGNGLGSETFCIMVQSPKGLKLTASTVPEKEKNIFRLEIERPTLEPGVWSLCVSEATTGKFEDAYFNFVGLRNSCLSFMPDWIFVRD